MVLKLKGGKNFLNKIRGLPTEEAQEVLSFCEQYFTELTPKTGIDSQGYHRVVLANKVLLGFLEELLEEKVVSKLLFKMFSEYRVLFKHSIYSGWMILHLVQSYIAKNNLRRNPDYLKLCVFAGLLHDVGMMEYPEEVIYSDQEFDLEKHVYQSLKYLEHANIPEESKFSIAQHHELMNGKGYPNKLTGEVIFFPARFLTIIDQYVAMTCSRTKEKELTPREAVKSMLKQIGKYDLEILSVFQDVVTEIYERTNDSVDTNPTDEIFEEPKAA